ncbi:MAG: CO dehydrogenase/acetyl-CoA synthase subunit delta [Thermofilum sp. ex4484_82]|nr:MAG: CO dehydrogenase/acetyl-CoA synthase subunit delta [Thermofilum sp. ex4484_82]OYT39735.1 MAG: CO dehydrogenase/acetyl-CoA synthase subunit delta [Archaeoglobales archaeon ex4484_92]RLE77686.1 MAG: CO dehydrogenase/acetyl-CoA synthase subunit delta [Thermoprotei archaeon]
MKNVKNQRENEENILGAKISELLKKFGEIILEDVEIEVDELELIIQPGSTIPIIKAAKAVEVLKKELAKEEFKKPIMEWTGKVVEVKIGATKSDGGTRDRSFVIGGETLPAFYMFEGLMPHPPVIAMDVFDMKISLPKCIKMHFADVMDDPAEWAKRCVEKYGAEMINLHLVSTDPYIKDTPPSEAARVVEEVLQAVKVPLCVGGSGDPVKDVKVFKKVVDVTEGERILLNSLNLDMKLEDIAEYLKNKDTVIIAFTPMDLDKARELNRKLYDYISKDRIVMDTNIAGIGYGLEYGFTVMERARIAALKGDTELQHPIVAGVTNAWAAREAWIKMDPFWGPREIRGPAWETITGLTALLAGADYFMMMHPTSIKTMKEIISALLEGSEGKSEDVLDWVSAKLG